MKTIVVGYDGSEPSRRALDRAADLSGRLEARLVVASVAEPLPLPAEPMAPMDMMVVPLAEPQPPTTIDADHELDDARKLLRERGVEADFVATSGSASDGIVDIAEREKADLIVVGSSEPGFLQRLLHGDVGAEITRRAPCDVLIVHR